MKVLVIDDDPVFVHVVSARLRKGGHEVTAAFDAMQAMMAVRREAPEAILLDVGLPGGTGFEVLRRLKASRHTSLVPVLVTSATTGFAARAEELGASAFLAKPIAFERLEEALAALGATPAPPVVAARIPPVIARP